VATSRLTLDLAESVRNRLELIRERTKAGSLVEVVRKALAVYDAVSEPGVKIIRRAADGTERELVIL